MSSSITTSLLTAGFTALLGLAVFVAGQFALKLFVEPIQAQKRVIGRTAHALTYYANTMEGSDPETVSEGRKVYRDLAAEFRASTNVIPLYRLFAWWGVVPPGEKTKVAYDHLIYLSNTIGTAKYGGEETERARREI